jgi:hypothetical protein
MKLDTREKTNAAIAHAYERCLKSFDGNPKPLDLATSVIVDLREAGLQIVKIPARRQV